MATQQYSPYTCASVQALHVCFFTDHSAVKAVLETPNPSGKHVRSLINSCLSRGRIQRSLRSSYSSPLDSYGYLIVSGGPAGLVAIGCVYTSSGSCTGQSEVWMQSVVPQYCTTNPAPADLLPLYNFIWRCEVLCTFCKLSDV